MNVVDKLYTEWAYRSQSGTPDIKNPNDKAILDTILAEFDLPINEEVLVLEADGSQYDQLISYTLFDKDVNKVADIPNVSKKYQIGKSTSITDPKDKEIWNKLYPVKPPKVGKEIGTAGTAGSGNGEVALYWLLSKSGYDVEDGRGDQAPDLIVGGKLGIEVKSVGKRNITLGRFGKDYETRKKLGYVLGLDVLISNLTGKDRPSSIDSFNKDELVRGFNQLAKFSSNENLRNAAQEFELINDIYTKIDSVTNDLNLEQGFAPKDGAAAILRQLLYTKAKAKPGFGGYIVDVSPEGTLDYKQITHQKIKALDTETILKYVSANGSALQIYPEELFGK